MFSIHIKSIYPTKIDFLDFSWNHVSNILQPANDVNKIAYLFTESIRSIKFYDVKCNCKSIHFEKTTIRWSKSHWLFTKSLDVLRLNQAYNHHYHHRMMIDYTLIFLLVRIALFAIFNRWHCQLFCVHFGSLVRIDSIIHSFDHSWNARCNSVRFIDLCTVYTNRHSANDVRLSVCPAHRPTSEVVHIHVNV